MLAVQCPPVPQRKDDEVVREALLPIHFPAVSRCAPVGGPDLGSWLQAALRKMDCGVVFCSSSEGALPFLLLGPRSACDELASHLPSALGDATEADPRADHGGLPDCSLLTLLFTDIVGSTRAVQRLGDEAWHALLMQHHATVRTHLALFQGKEIDKAGDGLFATFESPGCAVRCADALCAALKALGIDIRAGVHAGECKTANGQVSGVAVHVAARVAAIARPGEILVSSTVRDLLEGSDLGFSGGDWHTLRGLSGSRQLFRLNRSEDVASRMPLRASAAVVTPTRLRAVRPAPPTPSHQEAVCGK